MFNAKAAKVFAEERRGKESDLLSVAFLCVFDAFALYFGFATIASGPIPL
jgi:hypothetical protein